MTSSIWTGWPAFALNLVGAGFVAYSILGTRAEERPLWVLVGGALAVAGWVARSLCARLGARRLALVFAVISVVAGSLVTPATAGIAVIPVAISILILVGDVRWPVALGLGMAVGSVAVIAIGALPFGTPAALVLVESVWVVLAIVGGLSRRQFRRSEAQTALLRDREAAMREEAARISLARDIHDVLAHSLGGLGVQLDAVDALLEAGDTDAARRRVVDARGLAVNGLAEARRAVAALRDPRAVTAGPVGESELAASLDDLVGAHRALGGTASLAVSGRPRLLTAAQATAVQRALQEALSNARKHAPGQPVRADLDWKDDRVTLLVANPLPDSAPVIDELSRTGGGHGLEGMRERFAALPLGGSATAGADDGQFAVTVEAKLA